ncbi:MAG: amino acid ABC transporter substrate-binding protein [Chloroflexi bacterium]|nr:amino acid ABC transporter substrate-binding protein [Chloroflexota bacterium]
MRRIALPLVLLLIASVTTAACGPDADEEIIRIGAAVSETGRHAKGGEHVRRGYLLWEDWVNNEYGGIKVGNDRYQVELIMYDDQGDTDTTAALVERLIDEDKVDFLLGPYSSTLTQPAIEVAEERGMLLVEGSGGAETLFQQSYQNLFAVLTPAVNYTQSALRALAESGAKTIVIVHADSLFPTSVAEGAEHWAGEYGLSVLRVEAYSQDITDVTDIVSRLRDLEPDVFLGAGYFNDALLFVRAAKALDFDPAAMVLTVGPTDPALIEEVGEDANFLIGPTQWESTMSYRGAYFGSASDYAERYAAKWGGPPTYQAASGTAAALALQLAIEAAGTLNTDDVRAALRDLDASTFFGQISFDETGKNAARPMGAIQIHGGDIRVVAPPDAAVTELTYPVPGWKDR